MDTQLDYVVFIGRFEPFHNGHLAVARRALEQGKKLILIIGSAHKPRSIKNPWNVTERAVMIRTALGEYADRLIVGQVRDHLYNEDMWNADVQRVVRDAVAFDRGEPTGKETIGIIGHDKDQSSYYLKQFPQWRTIDVNHTAVLSATDLRTYLFEANKLGVAGGMMLIRANVPKPTFDMLETFRMASADFDQLEREYRHIKDYKAGWKDTPYPPQYVTSDAVVTYSGHILLVRRKAEPGKGQWALPGGFVKPHQRVLDAALAELREETRLKIPTPVVRGSLKNKEVFDHPDRSSRGRTFTHAFHFHFPSGELPPVKGGDDADKAKSFPISEALEMGR